MGLQAAKVARAFQPFVNCVLAVVALLSAPPAFAKSTDIVTESGALHGSTLLDGKVLEFRGVPYAKAPVGDLRWKPPLPPAKWSTVRDATKSGAACMQGFGGPEGFYTDNPETISEDCLFLNIWVPADAKNAPVMVFIHGGALIFGSGMNARYDGRKLAEKGIIAISINYRMGVFGYFSHPELTAESPNKASGNYGTLDQIEALKWVRRNIAAFGGDPHRVTIFGQSAGALSVTQLLASPLAKGLFQGAIAQSGYLPPMPELTRPVFGLEPAEEMGSKFAKSIGAPTLKLLRAIPADKLQPLSENVYSVNKYGVPRGATAVVDGWVQPAQMFETFENGNQSRVPFIAGYASGEMRSLDAAILPSLPKSAAEYEARVKASYGDRAEAFLSHYPSKSFTDSTLDAWRDAHFGWGMERLIRLHRRVVPSSWFYYFDHVPPAAAARNLGAFHSSDVPFVFGNVGEGAFAPKNWPSPPARPEDIAMSQAIMSYWTAFARSGSPETSGLPAWPAFDAADQSYMLFHDGVALPSRHLLPGVYELHDAHLGRLRSQGNVVWDWARTGVTSPGQ